MKKLSVFLSLILISFATTVKAQEFKNGDQVISVGIGLGSAIGNYDYSSQTPGISFQYEKGLWDIDGPGVISLGGYLGFKGYRNTYHDVFGYTYRQKWNYTIIGLRSAYHFNGLDVEKLDVYGGAMLSLNYLRYSDSDNNPGQDPYYDSYRSRLGLTLYIGGRYYLADKIAVYTELGYGVSFFNLGVAAKF